MYSGFDMQGTGVNFLAKTGREKQSPIPMRREGWQMAPDRIKTELQDLFQHQKLGVLATVGDTSEPYVSLVAFAATADSRELIFATTRTSRKFANLQADPRAALLIDSRTHQESDFHLGQALSATGTVIELSGPEKHSRLQLFLTKHPHLREFVQSPSCALMSMHVQVYNLVSKFQKVIEYRLSP
jgi:nitroimidazol reductase NimA-like FMN-containing flavoprotein (pyridoxamine 5'-phosphate oxidase superfamily)